MEDDLQRIDEALQAPSGIVSALGDIPAYYAGEAGGKSLRIGIDTVTITVPVELDVYPDKNGKITLGAGTEVYDVETSFTSVLHRLKLTLKVNHGRGDGQ